jgi:hypothetical protein
MTVELNLVAGDKTGKVKWPSTRNRMQTTNFKIKVPVLN